MLQEEHFQLLDQLRFGESFSERKDALISLKAYEDSGLTKDSDIKTLLNDDDSVTRNYAIGAAGRMKIESVIGKLIKDFAELFDPIILLSYVEAFIAYGKPDFVNPLSTKIKQLQGLAGKKTKHKALEGNFILEQIIIPSLKYFHQQGNASLKDTILSFLNDDDNNVRWHALKIIQQFQIKLPQNKLNEIAKKDPSRLNQELASIMLDKQ